MQENPGPLTRRRFINLVGKAGGYAAAYHLRVVIVGGGLVWTDDIGEPFAKLAPAQRIERTIAQAEKLHPSSRADVHRGLAVCWSKVPYSMGGWCEWSEDAKRNAYPVLLKPDGPLFLAGEHLSNLAGWQEGAILSAYKAMTAIAERAASRKT
jgi:monoamine oxidase